MNRRQFTVDDHLLGKDALIRSLYERFVELVEACGSFEYVVGKDGIAFKGTRHNFAVAKPKARSLDEVLVLQRRLQDPRIRAAQIYTKQLFGNQFRLTQEDQLDQEFAGWIQEAYQVGQGKHLTD
jgi:Domain of unknown function (DUF5655)